MNPLLTQVQQPEIRLVSCLIMQKNPQTDQFIRTNTVNASETVMIKDLIDNAGVHLTQPNAIASAAAKIIQPSRPKVQVHIPNGWTSPRASIHMRFVTDWGTRRYVELLNGYTDYFDPSVINSQSIDPNMTIFLSSYKRLLELDMTCPVRGQYTSVTTEETAQLMSSATHNQMLGLSGQNVANSAHSMRIVDVMRSIANKINNGGEVYTQTDLASSGVSQLTTSQTLLSNSELLPSVYLADALNSKRISSHSSIRDAYKDTYLESSETNDYQLAADAISVSGVNSSSVLSYFNEQFAFFSTGVLKMGNILNLWPDNIVGPSPYTVNTLTSGTIVDNTNLSNTMGAPSNHAQIAHQVSNMVPSVMADNGYATGAFMIEIIPGNFPNVYFGNTNPNVQTGFGHVGVIQEATVLPGMTDHDGSCISAIMATMSTAIAPSLAAIANDSVVVTGFVNLMSEITMNIKIGYSTQAEPYVLPCFASSITVPNVSIGVNDITEMANGVHVLLENHTNATAHNNTNFNGDVTVGQIPVGQIPVQFDNQQPPMVGQPQPVAVDQPITILDANGNQL